VLEQVSQLFADHPDLLMEFTYFLPDAVQEQVRQPLCATDLALYRTAARMYLWHVSV
jgi:histone deacetylase complex regulatory component SIN3